MKTRQKSKKDEFLGMLLCFIGASLLENMMAGATTVITGYVNKGQERVRVIYGSKMNL